MGSCISFVLLEPGQVSLYVSICYLSQCVPLWSRVLSGYVSSRRRQSAERRGRWVLRIIVLFCNFQRWRFDVQCSYDGNYHSDVRTTILRRIGRSVCRKVSDHHEEKLCVLIPPLRWFSVLVVVGIW